MALFIWTDNVVFDPASLHLLGIAGWNTESSGFTFTNAPASGHGVSGFGNIDLLKVNYSPVTIGFGQARINALANQIATDVVIVAKTSSDYWPNGAPISLVPALTGLVGATILVGYDYTDCGGTVRYIIGDNGQCIEAPPEIILAHELSHAFHMSIGDDPADPESREFQAINEENAHRIQLGYPQRTTAFPLSQKMDCGKCPGLSPFDYLRPLLKSLTGVLLSTPPPSTGTPHTNSNPMPGIIGDLADWLASSSEFGEMAYNQIFDDACQLKPRIEVDFDSLPEFKAIVRKLIVYPSDGFIELAHFYINTKHDSKNITVPAAPLLEWYIQELQNLGLDEARILHTASLITAVRTHVEGAQDFGNTAPYSKSLADVLIHRSLKHLAELISETLPNDNTLSWWIFRPAELFWSALTSREELTLNTCLAFDASLESWLGEIPIPSGYPDVNIETMEEDFKNLSKTLLRLPNARHLFGKRLLERIADEKHAELVPLMVANDYLAFKHDRD